MFLVSSERLANVKRVMAKATAAQPGALRCDQEEIWFESGRLSETAGLPGERRITARGQLKACPCPGRRATQERRHGQTYLLKPLLFDIGFIVELSAGLRDSTPAIRDAR